MIVKKLKISRSDEAWPNNYLTCLMLPIIKNIKIVAVVKVWRLKRMALNNTGPNKRVKIFFFSYRYYY